MSIFATPLKVQESAFIWRIAFALLLALVVAPAASAVPCSSRTISVSRASSSIFYFDPSLSPKLSSAYVAYKITNSSGAAIDDLWVKLERFAGGALSLAPRENGLSHIGPLARGASVYAYFYLSASRHTSSPQSHDVVVYDGNPDVASATCEQGFSYSTYDTISANPNKVTNVSISPSTPEVGGLLTITVRGNTGRVGSAGVFAYTPAVLASWPADAFELEDVEMILSGGENRTVRDVLAVTGISPEPSDYIQTYRFRIKGNPGANTRIYPANYISSGNEVKHTDTSNYSALPSIPSPTNEVRFSSFVTVPETPTCLAGGGTASLTLTIANGGTVPARLDNMIVSLPTSPATPSYVAGSAQYGGAGLRDPILLGSDLRWDGLFEVPAGSTRTLIFDVTIPAVDGAYPFSAIGHIDSLQIDSTLTQSESAPIRASVCSGTVPTATPTPTPTATPAGSDADTDDDGIPDSTEGTSDTDGDSKPNNEDRDSDNDGIPDIIEGGGEDSDKDGKVDDPTDSDGDGLVDPYDPDNGGTPLNPPDSDGDGIPDTRDLDSDDDGIPDVIEGGGQDTDGDGRVDPLTDDDDDGFPDTVDPDAGGDPLSNSDGDGDGIPDSRDGDSDGDGVPDRIEQYEDGVPTPVPGNDSDDDGINNQFDPDQGVPPYSDRDTDSDGQPDRRDTDSDGDGAPDQREAYDLNDDGTIDVTPSGTDSDGDGIDDGFEGASTIDGDYRKEAWDESCRAQSLNKKLRRVRSGTTALWKRVAMFASKSRQCKGPALQAEVDAAKVTYDSIMERLVLEYGGDTYRCPQNLCVSEKTSLGRSRLSRLVDELYRQARAAKKQAIVSCKTPPRDPSVRDPRWNTEDYRREIRSVVKELPKSITRCP
jgi:hypothetical protein